jgi:hypothetical protein
VRGGNEIKVKGDMDDEGTIKYKTNLNYFLNSKKIQKSKRLIHSVEFAY